jgi:DNA-binding transcriptional LysR family regulator
MLDWNDVRIFLALQRAGTLAGAASPLGINATTVGRRLAALEEAIGARLFDRTPDGYALTHAGRDLLPHAERMEADALALERDVAGADQRLAGVVRLSTTEMLGTRFLAPHLPRLHARHPAITLELSCTPRSISLARRDADVVLRLSRPREPDVIARELASIHLSLYAARSYLAVRGRPTGDLRGHAAILFAASPAFAIENGWLERELGAAEVVLRSDSVSAIFAATVAGLGIALLPRIVADDVPELERLPTESEPETRKVWQGVHRDLVRSPRVQAVLGFLGEVIGAQG